MKKYIKNKISTYVLGTKTKILIKPIFDLNASEVKVFNFPRTFKASFSKTVEGVTLIFRKSQLMFAHDAMYLYVFWRVYNVVSVTRKLGTLFVQSGKKSCLLKFYSSRNNIYEINLHFD